MYVCFKMLNSPTSRKGVPWHYWFAKSKTPEQPREQNSTTCDFGKLHVKQQNKKRTRVITKKRSNQPCLNENQKHHPNPNLLNKYSHWSLVTCFTCISIPSHSHPHWPRNDVVLDALLHAHVPNWLPREKASPGHCKAEAWGQNRWHKY